MLAHFFFWLKYTPLDDIIVECSCYMFDVNRSINSKWLLLDCANIALSERYASASFSI
jgi:hypothetical protein